MARGVLEKEECTLGLVEQVGRKYSKNCVNPMGLGGVKARTDEVVVCDHDYR